MKPYLFIFSIITFFSFSCDNNSQSSAAAKDDYIKNKAALQKEEEKNPVNFIDVNGYNKKNFLGQTVVKGSLTSKASVATFKDIDLQLSFFSKTNALLETDKETIFEILHPGETKDFKTKYFAPKGTDSVALSVLSAKILQKN